MYCRRCFYDLRNLPRHRCPECDRVFDPANPRTYRTTTTRRWKRFVLYLALSAGLAVSIPFCLKQYRAWQQRRFEQACAEISAAGGEVVQGNAFLTPELRDSAIGVDFYDADGNLPPLSAERLAEVRHSLRILPRFGLTIDRRKCAAGALAGLNGLKNLCSLSASDINGAALRGLRDLPRLQTVGLSGHRIADQVLLELKDLLALRCVALVRTSVSIQAARAFEKTVPGVTVFLSDISPAPPFRVEYGSGDEEPDVLVHFDSSGKRVWSVNVPCTLGQVVWNDTLVVVAQGDSLTALDAKTGRILWRSVGSRGALTISGDVIGSADMGNSGEVPPSVMARRLSDGKIVFHTFLPRDDGQYPTLIPLGGGFIFKVPRNFEAFVIDPLGLIRADIKKMVAAGIPYGSGSVVLTNDSVDHLDKEGYTLWSTPLNSPTANCGQILPLTSGDLVCLAYNNQQEGCDLLRLDAATGAVRWHEPILWTTMHSVYSLNATAEVRRGLLGVTTRDVAGLTLHVFDLQSGKLMMTQSTGIPDLYDQDAARP